MNQQFHNKRQTVWTDYSADQKYFPGHMFNIKLEEKPYKMCFKPLPVNIEWSNNRQDGPQCTTCNLPWYCLR